MTLELARVSTVHWMSPESGLWVASRNGEYIGMVERLDGRYHASDLRGRRRGTFDGLAEAQIAIDHERDEAARDRRELLMMRATIILTGLTTLGLTFGIVQLAS